MVVVFLSVFWCIIYIISIYLCAITYDLYLRASAYIYCYGLVYSEERWICVWHVHTKISDWPQHRYICSDNVRQLTVCGLRFTYWVVLFIRCVWSSGWSLLCCLFSSLVSFFSLYIFHIIFIVVAGNFLVVCLPYIFAFLLLLNCWTLVMNFALVVKRFIVQRGFFLLPFVYIRFAFGYNIHCLLHILHRYYYAPPCNQLRFRGVHHTQYFYLLEKEVRSLFFLLLFFLVYICFSNILCLFLNVYWILRNLLFILAFVLKCFFINCFSRCKITFLLL